MSCLKCLKISVRREPVADGDLQCICQLISMIYRGHEGWHCGVPCCRLVGRHISTYSACALCPSASISRTSQDTYIAKHTQISARRSLTAFCMLQSAVLPSCQAIPLCYSGLFTPPCPISTTPFPPPWTNPLPVTIPAAQPVTVAMCKVTRPSSMCILASSRRV